MSAAEKLERTPRQRRRDAIALMFASWAVQLADFFDETQPLADDGPAMAARRRTVQRRPYVPTHGQSPSPAAMAEAARQTRRRGLVR